MTPAIGLVIAGSYNGPMGDRAAEERELVVRFLAALGIEHKPPRSTILPAPDVHVHLADGRLLAIEQTAVHPDAGPGVSSQSRGQEESKAKAADGGPYTMFAVPSSDEAIEAAVRDKTEKAVGYRLEPGAELWLLLNGSLAKPGAAGSTFNFSALLDPQWTPPTSTHHLLSASRFEAAYLHLGLGGGLYEWKSNSGWQVRIAPQTYDEGRQMLDLIRSQKGTVFSVLGRRK